MAVAAPAAPAAPDPPGPPGLTVEALCVAFLGWTARHRAPATLRFYRQRLQKFRAEYGPRLFASLTPLDLDAHLHAAGAGQSDSTRRHNAVALTSLQAFALREKLLPPGARVFDRLEKPRMGRRERVPTPEEIERLLAAAPADFSLIYRALCQCGARPGELCGLVAEQIDWSAGVIEIREHKTARKTGLARRIPIGAKFAALLRAALEDRGQRTEDRGQKDRAAEDSPADSPAPPTLRPSGPVFLRANGRPWTPAHLSAVHRRLRDRAGLDRTIVLYLARHRFGTELIRSGADIKTVADLMGHQSVTTTQRYLHRDVTELRGQQDLV